MLTELEKADKLQRQSKFSDALSIYKKIEPWISSYNFDSEELFYLRLKQGHCARLAGDFKLAAKYYKLALKIGKKLGEIYIADASVGLGTALRAVGKLDHAIEKFNEALNIYSKNKDIEGKAYTLWAKAGALRFKGELKGALKTFKKALSIYEAMGDKMGVGYALCGLGGVSRIMGRFEDSLDYYTNANEILRSAKDKFGVAYSHCGIANANRMLGNYKTAEKHFKLATEKYKEIGDKVSYAYTLFGEATLYKMVGELDKASEKFEAGEKLFKETGDKRGLIYTRLGEIEIEFLKTGKIKNRFNKLRKNSTEYKLENLHVELLERAIKNLSLNQVLISYQKLGTKFFKRISLKPPLNIP